MLFAVPLLGERLDAVSLGWPPGSDGYRFGRKAHAGGWQTLNPVFFPSQAVQLLAP